MRIAAALALIGAPGTASACRVLTTPPKIEGEFQAIVVAEVSAARDTGRTGFWTWEIEANVSQVVDGRPGLDTYGFRYVSGSNGCDASPPQGLFVLYITRTPHGERVTEALPLLQAEGVDPRVRAARANRTVPAASN
ncbi:hypothetical protein [Brevundimonas sp. FT23042]|uniref:hypothetical protein n=1 Tax=Brevundimonas sp. FT23042 TaxID=3393749 RepID=UPI003B5881C3